MSDPRLRTILWSIVLTSSGVMLLLFEFGFLTSYTPLLQYILAGLFVFAAILFFGAFARAAAEWWRVIPGWTLLTLAGVLVLSTLAVNQRWLGATVFGGLALAFMHVYLTDRNARWWALIPGGFLLVLGLVIGVSVWGVAIEGLALLLFGGLGGVFFLLFLLHRRQWWAVLPGGVLVVFAALAAARGSDGQVTPLLRWWPLLLIGAGLLTALQVRRRPAPDKLQVNAAPARKGRTTHKTPPQTISAAPRTTAPRTTAPRTTVLGDYTQPAPGATVEVLPELED
jgi:hypothetical protein